jgi:hypothetical protein
MRSGTTRWRAGTILASALAVCNATAPESVFGARPGPTALGAAEAAGPAPLGVSYSGWRGGFADAPQRLQTFRSVGFTLVTLIPAYAYVGRNRIDLTSGPSAAELGQALELALRGGLGVVLKPHLEPPLYQPGYQRARSNNHSWRAECGWRGFFDVDPMTADYRDGVVFANLRVLMEVLDRLATAGVTVPLVRFELGAELMNSMVEFPDRWERLLEAARAERRRLGLEKRVLLSHNFSHHFAIPEDHIDRMSPRARKSLGRYVAGLDALALSQYMDLTVMIPETERAGPTPGRLPTTDEVAEALRRHELSFRRNILGEALGLRPARIPPLHIGEFGVGSGGLRHPNLWGPLGTPEEERKRAEEVARGHEGLVRYLSGVEGRTVHSAVLWVTGTHFDIFGWRNPAWANPAAAAAIRRYLRR